MPQSEFSIYATDLDKFRYALASGKTDAEIVRELDAGPDHAAMRRIVFGSFIHALIEYRHHPCRSTMEGIQVADSAIHHWHEIDCAHPIEDLPYQIDLPQIDITEVPILLTLPTRHGTVAVRGRIDAIYGNIGYDWKVSKFPSVERVATALQHRVYMMSLPTLESFRYYFFKASIPSPRARRPVYSIQHDGYFQIDRRPDNDAAVVKAVGDFMEFAAVNDWPGRT